MQPFNRDLVDPSVTDEEIERAHDGAAADFPDVEDQDELADVARQLFIVPAGKAQRIANARALREDHTFVGVGM
jgi:hypothetical protein